MTAPAMMNAHRQLPVAPISAANAIPPTAEPRGAPASRIVAPRPRSFSVRNTALSLPPAGMIGASVTPIRPRATAMVPMLGAMPERAVAVPHPVQAAVMSLRGPNRSMSHPAGICMAA